MIGFIGQNNHKLSVNSTAVDTVLVCAVNTSVNAGGVLENGRKISPRGCFPRHSRRSQEGGGTRGGEGGEGGEGPGRSQLRASQAFKNGGNPSDTSIPRRRYGMPPGWSLGSHLRFAYVAEVTDDAFHHLDELRRRHLRGFGSLGPIGQHHLRTLSESLAENLRKRKNNGGGGEKLSKGIVR